MSGNQRVVYLNGAYVPEAEAAIHIHDRGFIFGDAVFDTARTFGGEPFMLREHIERLYRSLKYVDIDPGLSPEEMEEISLKVLAENRPLLGENEDYWLFQRVTRGSHFPDGPGGHHGPTVVVTAVPLPLKERAALFKNGIDIAVPASRRTPPDVLSPNAKTHNYLNLIVAGKEVERGYPGAWPILLDTRGYLTEGSGSNLFIVRGGKVLTPKAQYVLAGLSRQVVLSLCEELAIPAAEEDIALFDAITADELFITSTSLCLCPARSVNGQPVGTADLPGPVTKRLMDGFASRVGFDYVGQYLAHL